MKLSAPKQVTWWVAVIIALLGLLSSFVSIPVLSSIAIWVVFIGFVILALGTILSGF